MVHLINRELKKAKNNGIDISYEILFKLYNEDNNYEFALLLKNKKFNSKKSFSSFCDKCHEIYTLKYCKFNLRTKDWNYCKKCYHKEITNSEEWRNKNSKAQKIAQNRSEVKKKISKSLIKFWSENPDVKEKMINNVKKYYTDEIREQVSKKSVKNNLKSTSNFLNTPYSGYVWNSTEKIRFDSLLELSFIIYQYELGNKVERYKGYIEYDAGYTRRYIPDFIINNTIIEVKSKYFYNKNKENINLKAEAVKSLNIRYSIITEDEIKIKYFKRCKQSIIKLLTDFDVVFNKENKYSKWLKEYETKI